MLLQLQCSMHLSVPPSSSECAVCRALGNHHCALSQMPHFLALAWLCREDYARGGYKMLSLVDISGRRTAACALRNSLYLLPAGCLATYLGVAAVAFSTEAAIMTGANGTKMPCLVVLAMLLLCAHAASMSNDHSLSFGWAKSSFSHPSSLARRRLRSHGRGLVSKQDQRGCAATLPRKSAIPAALHGCAPLPPDTQHGGEQAMRRGQVVRAGCVGFSKFRQRLGVRGEAATLSSWRRPAEVQLPQHSAGAIPVSAVSGCHRSRRR